MLIVVGPLVVLALVALVPVERLVATRRQDVVRGLVGAVALVAVAGALGLVASVGNPFTWAADQIGGSGEVANDPGRLGSLETNNRTVWWGEAWQVFRAHPAGGTGARTFEIARKRYRDDAANVTEPHSLPLQLLSDTGLPGAPARPRARRRARARDPRDLRRLEPGERAAAVGLVALPLAFGLHSLVDYDLDFLAVAAPTALVSAALLAAGRPSAIARSRAIITACAVVGALAAVWVLAAPELSTRAVDRAYRQFDAGDLSAAASSARRAQSLNPLSPEPLYARATVASRAGDNVAAEEFYEQATRLQPENPEPGTSSDSSGRSRSKTSAARTSPSMPPTRSIRRAPGSRRRARCDGGGCGQRSGESGLRAVDAGNPGERLKPLPRGSGFAAFLLRADDDDGVGAVELRGAQAVERADDADPEITREPAALAFEALAVHDEAAREVRAGRVRDAADLVAATRDA